MRHLRTAWSRHSPDHEHRIRNAMAAKAEAVRKSAAGNGVRVRTPVIPPEDGKDGGSVAGFRVVSHAVPFGAWAIVPANFARIRPSLARRGEVQVGNGGSSPWSSPSSFIRRRSSMSRPRLVVYTAAAARYEQILRAQTLAHRSRILSSMAQNDGFFVEAVRRNRSIAGVLRSLGLRSAGANYLMGHRRVRDLRLCTKHWTGKGHLRGRTHTWAKKLPLTAILCKPSLYRGGTATLKERLFREGLLTRRCARCEIETWCGAPLALHLDHVNGDPDDNRLQNLRVLCPNCHSQTPTYCGRNKGRGRRDSASLTESI